MEGSTCTGEGHSLLGTALQAGEAPGEGDEGEAAPCSRTCSSVPSFAPIWCCSSCLAFTQVAMSCCRALVGTASSGTDPLVRFRANSQT